jgi:(p)ppGpp synthase/HD superfamily hydrolase
MSTLERAVVIAAEAHVGQVDKAGAPYILHPLRLMLQMGNTEDRIVAVLHDVVEDSDWSFEGLREEGFSKVILEAIDSVTRRPEEDYEDFILRSMQNSIGCRVKLADLRDNCNLSRIANPSETDFKRVAKYRQAIGVIEGHGKRDDFSPE